LYFKNYILIKIIFFLLILNRIKTLRNPLDYFIDVPLQVFLSLKPNYKIASEMFDFDVPFIIVEQDNKEIEKIEKYIIDQNGNKKNLRNSPINYEQKNNKDNKGNYIIGINTDEIFDISNIIRYGNEYKIKIGRFYICSQKADKNDIISVDKKCYWKIHPVVGGYLLKRNNQCITILENNFTINMEQCHGNINQIFYFKRLNRCDLESKSESKESTDNDILPNKLITKEKGKKSLEKKKEASKRKDPFKKFIKKNNGIKKSWGFFNFFKKLNNLVKFPFRPRFNILDLFCY
ncbi:hypothetical protein SLOPH_524, partial [Spraguea lophii 42_110]